MCQPDPISCSSALLKHAKKTKRERERESDLSDIVALGPAAPCAVVPPAPSLVARAPALCCVATAMAPKATTIKRALNAFLGGAAAAAGARVLQPPVAWQQTPHLPDDEEEYEDAFPSLGGGGRVGVAKMPRAAAEQPRVPGNGKATPAAAATPGGQLTTGGSGGCGETVGRSPGGQSTTGAESDGRGSPRPAPRPPCPPVPKAARPHSS